MLRILTRVRCRRERQKRFVSLLPRTHPLFQERVLDGDEFFATLAQEGVGPFPEVIQPHRGTAEQRPRPHARILQLLCTYFMSVLSGSPDHFAEVMQSELASLSRDP